MQMKMENGLTSSTPVVEDGAIAGMKIPLRSEFSSNELEFAEQPLIFRGSVMKSSKVFARANQNVGGRLRADIFERENLLVFVNEFRRNFLGTDFAKKTMGVHHFTPEGAASSRRTTNGVKSSLLRN
jgi:hypothetical protein